MDGSSLSTLMGAYASSVLLNTLPNSFLATAKHFLNDPSSLVIESLQGLCAINPNLRLDANNKVVYFANQDRSKVALICGGGSGHEPSHAGFVGQVVFTILTLFSPHTILY